MILWILSQDKTHFFPNPKLSVEIAGGKGYIVDNDTQTILGRYDNPNRAKEVLENIKDFIVGNEEHNGNYEESDLFVKTMIWMNMVKAYEIPKE